MSRGLGRKMTWSDVCFLKTPPTAVRGVSWRDSSQSREVEGRAGNLGMGKRETRGQGLGWDREEIAVWVRKYCQL